MDEKLLHKYARFLLKDCLKVYENQPVLVNGTTDIEEFMMIVKEEAEALHAEVHLSMPNREDLRDLYLHASYEECIQSPLLDKHFYNEMALRDGAVLSLASPRPHIFDGVDALKMQKIAIWSEEQIREFRKKQNEGKQPWCIAAAANPYWAKELFLDDAHAYEKLWNTILDICNMESDDPKAVWEEYFELLAKRCQILNNMKIKTLHYTSKNGTDITFDLPQNYVFASAKDSDYIVNMPSLEMFTTPLRNGVNGIVYNSKPLYHNGVMIDRFWLQFSNGRIVNYHAEVNQQALEGIIETDEGSHYLGEVSFVDFDSKINQTGILFEETLFDENACCHLAIGQGFSECFVNGVKMREEELKQAGMNTSTKHVDFMVGTRDLEIVATLQDGSEVPIMKQGKLVI